MRPWVRCCAAAWVMWLAVSGAGAEDGSGNGSLKMSAVKADEMEIKLNELTMAFRKLLSDSAELQMELQEKELANKALSSQLALAQNEAAMLREKLKQAPPGQSHADTAQAMQRVEEERQKLADELARLKVVLDQALHGKEGMSLAQRAQALAEAERVKRLLASQQPMAQATAALATNGVAAIAPTLESGQVLSFNSELKVAVLNLGEAQGVRLGMPFVVVRGDRIIAHVKVVEVRQKISGAVIERLEHGIVIQSGDRVRLTKS